MNWDSFAVKMGYPGFNTMFLTLYVVRKMNLTDIAKELGCSVQTLRRLIVKNGLESYLRKKGKVALNIDPEELKGTIDEAAFNTGKPRSTIWYRRKRVKELIESMKDTNEKVEDALSILGDKMDSALILDAVSKKSFL